MYILLSGLEKCSRACIDTEDNIKGILNYCTQAEVHGIMCFGMGVTLREGDREYFYKNMDQHFPGLKEKYQRKYGYAYEIISDNNDKLMRIFYETCNEHNIICSGHDIFGYLHEFEAKENLEQLSLF